MESDQKKALESLAESIIILERASERLLKLKPKK